MKELILKTFDPDKETFLETDASDYAIGAVLYQKHEGRKLPIAFMSKKLADIETRYLIHDKELYAIVEACRQWRSYLQGNKFPIQVFTDHKNLTWFFTTKELNRRLTRWWEELAPYDLRIIHTPGKDNAQADALSRRPDHEGTERIVNSILTPGEDGSYTVNQYIKVTTRQNLQQAIKKANETDTVAKQVMESKEIPEHYSIKEGNIYFKGRIYVPATKQLRDQILEEYHDSPIGGHQGVEKTLERIKRTYFWPGITKSVKEYIATCDSCFRNKAHRHKEYGQLQSLPTPTRQGQQISLDFITGLESSTDPCTNVSYDGILTIVDRLSKYTWFMPWKSQWDVKEFANIFIRYIYVELGVPEAIISDRDTRFTSTF